MTALSEFAQAVVQQGVAKPDKRDEWWRHRLVFDQQETRCVYCGAMLSLNKKGGPGRRGCMDHLVPLFHVGPQETKNLVPACYPCHLAKRSSDLLMWEPPRIKPAMYQSLLERRLRMLAWSANHVLRKPGLGKRKDTVLRHLHRRWEHPRVAAWAALTDEAGFISLVAPNTLPENLVPMLRSLRAEPVRTLLFRVPPHRFHDAVWALIDHNALVRRIDLPGHPDPTPDEPGDSQWHATFSSVLDVKRRRPKRKPIRLSALERPMDWGQRLLIELHGNWVPTGKFDWDWVNKHKETDCAWARQERERLARERRELEAALAAMPPPFTVEYLFQEVDRRLAASGSGEDTLARLAREYLPAEKPRIDTPSQSDPACCPE
jgi:hypothetical protein